MWRPRWRSMTRRMHQIVAGASQRSKLEKRGVKDAKSKKQKVKRGKCQNGVSHPQFSPPLQQRGCVADSQSPPHPNSGGPGAGLRCSVSMRQRRSQCRSAATASGNVVTRSGMRSRLTGMKRGTSRGGPASPSTSSCRGQGPGGPRGGPKHFDWVNLVGAATVHGRPQLAAAEGDPTTEEGLWPAGCGRPRPNQVTRPRRRFVWLVGPWPTAADSLVRRPLERSQPPIPSTAMEAVGTACEGS